MLAKHATLEQIKKVELVEPWSDIRFRRSVNGKGWVLKNVHHSILNFVKIGLFDHQCKLLSPVYPQDRKGFYRALHFSADKHTIGNLAGIFPCEPGDTPLKINNEGDVLFGAAAMVSLFAEKQQVAATPDFVLFVIQEGSLKDAADETALTVQ